MSEMLFKQTIADQINAERDTGVYGSVDWTDVREAEFTGIDLEAVRVRTRRRGFDEEWHTVPALPILNELLNQAINPDRY